MARSGKNPFSAPASNRPIKPPSVKTPSRPHPSAKAATSQMGGVRKSAPSNGSIRSPKVTVTSKTRKPVARKSPNTPKRAPGSMH